jgi:hypothetical protein
LAPLYYVESRNDFGCGLRRWRAVGSTTIVRFQGE